MNLDLKKDWKEFVVPTGVLAAICLVVSGALSITYGLTSPVIEENDRRAAEQAMMQVLPQADGFNETTEGLPEGVQGLYSAQNGSGVVVKTVSSGYGGTITMMVGVKYDGSIGGVSVLSNSETQGLGSRVMDVKYTSQFTGKSSPEEVESISGATVSSKALKLGIQTALDAARSEGGIG